jgi:hypothetical protein
VPVAPEGDGCRSLRPIGDNLRTTVDSASEPSSYSGEPHAVGAQGQGIGARLLQPTPAEADQAGANCWLETFDKRNSRFYQRLGFAAIGSQMKPVTASAYTIMNRSPKPRPG